MTSSIGLETVAGGHLPGGCLPGMLPFEEGVLICRAKFRSAQQSHCLGQTRRPRGEARRPAGPASPQPLSVTDMRSSRLALPRK